MRIESQRGPVKSTLGDAIALVPYGQGDAGDGYFGVSFNSLLVCGVFGLTVGVPLSVRT
jgi:hypothetical protein